MDKFHPVQKVSTGRGFPGGSGRFKFGIILVRVQIINIGRRVICIPRVEGRGVAQFPIIHIIISFISHYWTIQGAKEDLF